MIYKFKFEVWTDDNQCLFHSSTQESGNFWTAFIPYMRYLMDYVAKSRIGDSVF